ncbi:hypothetical protein QE450_000861 [Paenibacillus sp. SORGH_AS306]|uniref:PH domain-containing protein n=1 Tax=unclassified Paenibacillus TaxID=185978 RepID=UPI00278A608D|nr:MULTISPECIES: PH domain-containing protein [unclassified Paenibacillus]MDQ1233363.1 hypothetical protein [Paenibacillus sp. SORGH_AS_0306]MDR6110404.1 hypothetical protein [Paenibacillus sp. SORGH_AS_0338]
MAKIDKLKEKAWDLLQPGEEMLAVVMGACESKILGKDTLRTGIFVATQTRIFFYCKRTFGYDSESFPFSNISSIDAGKSLLGRNLTFYASGNKISMKWITIGEYDKFIEIAQSNIGSKSTTSFVDPLDQLKKLGELRDSGILTEQEFLNKKRELLS